MHGSNAKARGYTGTASPVQILSDDPSRTYICFYSILGDCEISIGGDNFDDTKIVLPEGTMWEPQAIFYQDVSYRGLGTKLCVIS